MSSPVPSSLPRLLLGSLIGAVIGLILLALGVAILWKAAELRGARPEGVTTPAASASPAPAAPVSRSAEATSPVPYPAVGAGQAPPVRVPIEPPPGAATSIWRSIFDDGDDQGAPVAEAETEAVPPRAAPAASPSRPAPRPSTPRRPPEAQRQDDSLFF